MSTQRFYIALELPAEHDTNKHEVALWLDLLIARSLRENNPGYSSFEVDTTVWDSMSDMLGDTGTSLTPKQSQVLLAAAGSWLEELHNYIIPGASCEEERDDYELQAYRIEDALRAIEESMEEKRCECGHFRDEHTLVGGCAGCDAGGKPVYVIDHIYREA